MNHVLKGFCRQLASGVGLAIVAVIPALLFAGVPSAVAQTESVVTLRTPPLIADPTGSLRCVALNLTDRPIGITAQIITDDGNNVTDFIRTFWQDEGGTVLAEVISASFHNQAARYCLITATGGTKGDIAGLLVKYDSLDNPIVQRRAR